MVKFTCSATDLEASALRWFFNDDLFATYTFVHSHKYPFTLMDPDIVNVTYDALLGGVGIKILSASHNEDNDRSDFLSTITVNISVLQGAGVTDISCGLFNVTRRAYADVVYNMSRGKLAYPHKHWLPCHWE